MHKPLNLLKWDELYTPLAQVLEAESNLKEFSRGSSWVWTAMDPVSKLLMVMIVGDRSLVGAQAVVHQVKQRLGRPFGRLVNTSVDVTRKPKKNELGKPKISLIRFVLDSSGLPSPLHNRLLFTRRPEEQHPG